MIPSRVAIIDHQGHVLLLSNVWVHPKNVLNYVTNGTSLLSSLWKVLQVEPRYSDGYHRRRSRWR